MSIDRNTGNLILCITEAVIGILLLIDPIGFTSGIIMALGLVLGILGIKELLGHFRADPEIAAKKQRSGKGVVDGSCRHLLYLKSRMVYCHLAVSCFGTLPQFCPLRRRGRFPILILILHKTVSFYEEDTA